MDPYGWNEAAPHTDAYINGKIVDLIAGLSPQRVCDVGCGNGVLLAQINQKVSASLCGVEQDAIGAGLATARCPSAEIHNLSIEDGPGQALPPGSFDVVVSTEVIEHLFRPESLITFSHDILCDGGHLILSTHYHGYLKNLAFALAGGWDKHFSVDWNCCHIKFFSRRTLSSLLESNGFEVVGFYGVGRMPYLWKSMLMVARKSVPLV